MLHGETRGVRSESPPFSSNFQSNLSREGQHVTFVHIVHDRLLLLDFVRAIRKLPLNRSQVAEAANSVVRVLEEYTRSIGIIKSAEAAAKTPVAAAANASGTGSTPTTAAAAQSGSVTSVATAAEQAPNNPADAAANQDAGARDGGANDEAMDATDAADNEPIVVVGDVPQGTGALNALLNEEDPLNETYNYDGAYRNDYGDTEGEEEEEEEEEAAYDDDDEAMPPVAHGQNSSSSSHSGGDDDDEADAEREIGRGAQNAFEEFGRGGPNQVEIELNVVQNEMAGGDLTAAQRHNVINILDDIAENDDGGENETEASEGDETDDEGEDTEDDAAGEDIAQMPNDTHAPTRAHGGDVRAQVRNLFDLNMQVVQQNDDDAEQNESFAINNGLLRVCFLLRVVSIVASFTCRLFADSKRRRRRPRQRRSGLAFATHRIFRRL